MLEHIYECEPELCYWWSPIPRKGNSELELNMVLLCSIILRSTQNLKGKTWFVVQVIGLTSWLTLAPDLDDISSLIWFSTFLRVCPYPLHEEKGLWEEMFFKKMMFSETLFSFINQGWLWEYMNIKVFYSVIIKLSYN